MDYRFVPVETNNDGYYILEPGGTYKFTPTKGK